MKKPLCIKRITVLFVFVLSFVFQTAYSISFTVSGTHSPDYSHKQVDKSAAKEETSENSFIEKETENDNELDFELVSFIVPQLFFQVVSENDKHPVLARPVAFSSNKESIFIAIHNFRI
ncbi:MAG: hypothetical protein K0S33_3454 [Bacteroidetes bacterium]|jgi:hypothetical protein|nr:hypothetical protein [Bacteroidota bacterium]